MSIEIDHPAKTACVPSVIKAPMPDALRVALDALGVRYIPVFKDNNIYYVESSNAAATCEECGLVVGRKLDAARIAAAPRVTLTSPKLHLPETLRERPSRTLAMIAALHGIEYTEMILENDTRVWTHQSRIIESIRSIPVRDYYTQDAFLATDCLIHYYAMFGIDFVCVVVGNSRIFIPHPYVEQSYKRYCTAMAQ